MIFICLSATFMPPAASVPPLDHVRVRPGAILLPFGNFYASGGFLQLENNPVNKL